MNAGTPAYSLPGNPTGSHPGTPTRPTPNLLSNFRPIASQMPNRLASVKTPHTYDRFFANSPIPAHRVPLAPNQARPMMSPTSGSPLHPNLGLSNIRPANMQWSIPGKPPGVVNSMSAVGAAGTPLAQRLGAAINANNSPLQPRPSPGGPMPLAPAMSMYPGGGPMVNMMSPGGIPGQPRPGVPHMGMMQPNMMHQHQQQGMGMPMPPHQAAVPRPMPRPPPVPRPNTFSTYAARLQDGTTSLLVPIEWSNPRSGGGSGAGGGRRGGRRILRDDSDSEDESIFDEEGRPEKASSRNLIALGQPPAIVDGQVISRVMKGTDHMHLNDYAALDLAKLPEFLIPVRIDLDLESTKLHDVFMWNLNETYMTPEKFAQLLCQDLNVANTSNIDSISQSIRAQLSDYTTFYDIQKMRHEELTTMNDSSGEASGAPAEYYVEPIRVTILLDLQLLRDQFEWDLTTSLNDENGASMPEEFARGLAADLGLGGEFPALIAHNIREQLLRYQRERLDLEVDTGLLEVSRGDPESLDALPMPTEGSSNHHQPASVPFKSDHAINVFRPPDKGELWTPQLEELTQDDLEKIMIDRERSIRRLRRETSRLLHSSRQRRGSPQVSTWNYELGISLGPQRGPVSLSAHLPNLNTSGLGSGGDPAGSASGYTPRMNPTLSAQLYSPPHSHSPSPGPGQRPVRTPSQSSTRSSRLSEDEVLTWRCTHCGSDGTRTTVVRKGPRGIKTLCNACGISWASRGALPPNRKNMYSKVCD
ncbi:hypothetical protein BJ085DRAFT_32902 [Dimargaris cristalligena]|uniref:GATA-type domain-containing protein n=1 Tax=Dimargaris cristalligena TaxID=215637 RepID=A0A4Q0A2P7_9FUNG|nr:hypothetical protein BJ085DRAFT_32902 [Dimargaris cristalligena]|eukprot:RKP40383.1 hypothetical protein BJ085DRAFT_32902 [Dimargaris cristalligena]